MKKKKNGFTVSEFLVVIFIISILSGLSFSAYRAGEKTFALQRASQQLAQDIRRAEEMAISARICEICTPKGVPKGGYGVYLEQGASSYSIYANLKEDKVYNEGEDLVVETGHFEKSVISRLMVSDTFLSSLSINFEPPDPKVTIGNQSLTSTEAEIVISLSADPSKTKKIKVNKAGLIYVE